MKILKFLREYDNKNYIDWKTDMELLQLLQSVHVILAGNVPSIIGSKFGDDRDVESHVKVTSVETLLPVFVGIPDLFVAWVDFFINQDNF